MTKQDNPLLGKPYFKENGSSIADVALFVAQADDHDLDRIATLMRDRRRQLRTVANYTAEATIEIGDLRRLQNVSPKYAEGALVRVIGRARTKFVVELVEGNSPTQERFGRAPFRCPAGMLAEVDG